MYPLVLKHRIFTSSFLHKYPQELHAVSLDWFLSGLEWIGVLLAKPFNSLSEMIMEYQI